LSAFEEMNGQTLPFCSNRENSCAALRMFIVDSKDDIMVSSTMSNAYQRLTKLFVVLDKRMTDYDLKATFIVITNKNIYLPNYHD
jgi:hypothetical protein